MIYDYWYANIEGIGNKKKIDLIKYIQEPEELYKMNGSRMQKIPGISQDDAERIEYSKKVWKAEEEYRLLQSKKIRLLTWKSTNYPEKLRVIDNPPYALYIKGSYFEQNRKTAAIVGARVCSEYGRTIAKQLGNFLGEHGIDVISGMAEGIDAAGHFGALCGNGKTFAVLGCGVEICYPKKNHILYKKIQENGSLISEFPILKNPLPKYFPMRNRLISGLADIVIIIEARKRSGSLITADFALEQGKLIYAVPGRFFDGLSEGTNRLIAQGAGILCSFWDILFELDIIQTMDKTNNNLINLPLEKSEKLVYSCVDLSPKSLDELLTESKLEFSKLVRILSVLQTKGYIKEVYKNYYITQNMSIL